MILENLRKSGLNGARPGSWARVIVEKPFGTDLASAQRLNQMVRDAFSENDTFRIDHYLGKETAQNIMVMRFANAIFEQLWNARYIDHVQITASEPLGVEGRAGYYDKAGALRDMVKIISSSSYALPPWSRLPASTRMLCGTRRSRSLKSLRPITGDEVRSHVVERNMAQAPSTENASLPIVTNKISTRNLLPKLTSLCTPT